MARSGLPDTLQAVASDTPDDPLRTQLNWPEHDLVPATRRDPDAEPTAASETTFDEEGGSVLFTVASRLESLRVLLNGLAQRLDTLLKREEQFREFTTSRLAEYAEHVTGAISGASGDAQDLARAQDRLATGVSQLAGGYDDLTRRVEQLVDGIERMDALAALAEELPIIRAELMASIARTESRDEELTSEVARLSEEMRALRRRMPIRAREDEAAHEDEQGVGRRSGRRR